MKIEDADPDDDDASRVARVDLRRDIHRPIFNIVWKSLFEGLRETTGAKRQTTGFILPH